MNKRVTKVMNQLNTSLIKTVWLGMGLIPGLVAGPRVMAGPPIGVLTGEGSVDQLRQDGIRYQEMGFMTLAEEAYQEALALEDRANLLPPERDADVPFNLGLIYLQKGDISQARQMFQRAYDASPNNFQVIYHLGTTELRLGNQEEARRHLTRLEDAAKNNPDMQDHLESLIALLDPPTRLDNHSFTDGNAPTPENSSSAPLSSEAASLLPPDQVQATEPPTQDPAAGDIALPEPPGALQQIRNRREEG